MHFPLGPSARWLTSCLSLKSCSKHLWHAPIPISPTCARKSLFALHQPRENLIARQPIPPTAKGTEGVEGREERLATSLLPPTHQSRSNRNHFKIRIRSQPVSVQIPSLSNAGRHIFMPVVMAAKFEA